MEPIQQKILGLSRFYKRFLLMANDAVLSFFALWISFSLRVGPPSADYFASLITVLIAVPIVSVFCLWMTGLYNYLLREIDLRILNTLAFGIISIALLFSIFNFFDSTIFIPRSIPIIFAIVLLPLIGVSRIIGRWYYRQAMGLHHNTQPVVIYGTSDTGINTAAVLDYSRDLYLVGFIDDDPSLKGSKIKGRLIYGTNELAELCVRFPNLRVLVSISNASAKRKHQIIENLQAFPVQVVSIPPLNEIADGTARVENLQEIDIQDLLGRDSVPPIEELFHQALQGKTVFVSGAGGSIGSEICSQIAANHPKLIIAVDNSELALYGLQQKLISKMHEEGIESNVEFKLADITNEIAVRHLIKSYKPDVVYHAAAYKHVPIAEKNILSTIQNNVLGTYSFANICAEEKVRHFILISTDKAVRPTNVMGASKRLAELVIQMMHQSHKNTIFSMVRFGNVLGSSGSVIPLFRKQIEAGGPVTVTHPKVIRFFMTITEAAQLVIQSGFISKGGDVFVLDMGEQITIDQLARLMIQLSGKTVRDKDHPNGDIEIVYTGLRPGEKLYEELLIGDNPEATIHPKIMVANETSIKKPVLQKNLRSLQNHIAVQDAVKAITVMEQLVEGFKYKNGKTLPDDSCN